MVGFGFPTGQPRIFEQHQGNIWLILILEISIVYAIGRILPTFITYFLS
jgi:hypothetical protein